MDELKGVIKELKNKKAHGPDIANEFLKLAHVNILKLILDFLNLNLKKRHNLLKLVF